MSPLSLILNDFSIGAFHQDAEWITLSFKDLRSLKNSRDTLTKTDTHGRKAVFRVFCFH